MGSKFMGLIQSPQASPQELARLFTFQEDPLRLAYTVASLMNLEAVREQALLEASAVNPTYGDGLIGLAIADYQQGATVKIMFIHVPNAWLAMGVWAVMSIASIGTLVWRHPLADVAAKSADIQPPSEWPQMTAALDPAASITARTSLIRCSNVGSC